MSLSCKWLQTRVLDGGHFFSTAESIVMFCCTWLPRRMHFYTIVPTCCMKIPFRNFTTSEQTVALYQPIRGSHRIGSRKVEFSRIISWLNQEKTLLIKVNPEWFWSSTDAYPSHDSLLLAFSHDGASWHHRVRCWWQLRCRLHNHHWQRRRQTCKGTMNVIARAMWMLAEHCLCLFLLFLSSTIFRVAWLVLVACSVVAALADWLPANVQYHLRQWYCSSTLRANMAAWYDRLWLASPECSLCLLGCCWK